MSGAIAATTDIFVYGTLISGFTNYLRYLGLAVASGGASFSARGKTVETLPLVVRPPDMDPKTCGPVLMDCVGLGHRITGEIYRVNDRTLAAMDLLEGVAGGYYYRRSTEIEVASGEAIERRACEVYFFPACDELLRQPLIAAYTTKEHAVYCPPPALNAEIVRLCKAGTQQHG